MIVKDQILFFWSALGAFNGLLLSVYFCFLIKNKTKSTHFLAALFFVVSVRVTKSVFLNFYSNISSLYVQVGLTACFLIGPFLYLYCRSAMNPNSLNHAKWYIHVIPIMVFMVLIGSLYPYNEHMYLWNHRTGGILGWMLFFHWFGYIIAAFYQVRFSILKILSKEQATSYFDYWILNILTGIFLIWLAYITNSYTSYIVGSLFYSFIFYISFTFWFMKKKTDNFSFLSPQIKYENKRISNEKGIAITNDLNKLILEEKVHLNPDLNLFELANRLQIQPYELSQYLNDIVRQNFSNYINGYRIEASEKMMRSKCKLTMDGIGYECGFRSKSSFYIAFKKVNGMTPGEFKKSLR